MSEDRSRRPTKLIAAGVLAGLLILVATGGVLIYQFWQRLEAPHYPPATALEPLPRGFLLGPSFVTTPGGSGGYSNNLIFVWLPDGASSVNAVKELNSTLLARGWTESSMNSPFNSRTGPCALLYSSEQLSTLDLSQQGATASEMDQIARISSSTVRPYLFVSLGDC